MEQRKVALVTGASAGVGRATAIELAGGGLTWRCWPEVVPASRQPAAEVETEGGRPSSCRADVADYEAVDRAASQGRRRAGSARRLGEQCHDHQLFAALGHQSDDFRRAIEVTFLGQVWGTMAALDTHATHGIGATSSTLDPRWPSSAFRCSRRTVRPSSPAEGSSSPLGPSCCTRAAMSACPWCTCRPSTRRSSTGARPRWTATPSRCRRSISPRSQPNSSCEAALDGRRSKVIGSWNKLLVAAGQIAPGVGNHYAALGAWDTQLADLPIGRRPTRQPEPSRR